MESGGQSSSATWNAPALGALGDRNRGVAARDPSPGTRSVQRRPEGHGLRILA